MLFLCLTGHSALSLVEINYVVRHHLPFEKSMDFLLTKIHQYYIVPDHFPLDNEFDKAIAMSPE